MFKKFISEYETKENINFLMKLMGFAMFVAKIIIILNQPVWVASKFLDYSNDIPLYPDWLTNWVPELFLLMSSLIIGLMLVKVTYFKLSEFSERVVTPNTSVLWVFLTAVVLLISVYGSLYMNKDIYIGLAIWSVATISGFIITRYVPVSK